MQKLALLGSARRRTAIAIALAAALGGCATFSPDGGMNEVRTARAGPSWRGAARAWRPPRDAAAVRKRGRMHLLAQPLTADSAVEIALLNNPGLQAKLAELGIAEADLVQAGRLRNPVFAYSNKRNGGNRKSSARCSSTCRPVDDAVGARHRAAPVRAGAGRRPRRSRGQVAGDARRRTSAPWPRRSGSSTTSRSGWPPRRASSPAHGAAGNFSKLAQMREQAFYADATAQLARARHQAVAERERLTRLLGCDRDAARFTAGAAARPARCAARAGGRRADRAGQAPRRAAGQARQPRRPRDRSA